MLHISSIIKKKFRSIDKFIFIQWYTKFNYLSNPFCFPDNFENPQLEFHRILNLNYKLFCICDIIYGAFHGPFYRRKVVSWRGNRIRI